MPCPKNMRGCRRGCLHRDRVEGYYRLRDDQLARAEEAAIGYDTETALYFDPHSGTERRVVFKNYLIDTTDHGREENAA